MYNFSRFERCMLDLKQQSVSLPTVLKNLQTELNRFFRDSSCIEVIYTNNTDKPFFGMSVIPTLPSDYLIKCISSEKKIRFERYIIDIDSKLLDPVMNLTARQLVAILLHEVGHVVNNTNISNEIQKAIHVEIARTGIELKFDKIDEAESFLNICTQQSIRKIYSFFEKNDEEYIADEFVVKCGYGADLESSYDKIIKNRDVIKGKQNAFLSLFWGFGLYLELAPRRNMIVTLLNSSKENEASTGLKRHYDRVIRDINNRAIKLHKKNVYTTEALCEGSFLQSIKFSNIKTLEDDLYEFRIRINAIDSQTEALATLRSINMRISLIDEYVTLNGATLNDKEKHRLFDLSKKYQSLREEMVRKGSYDRSIYGLFVKYPQISNNY